MTTIDNSNTFYSGVCDDVTVNVAASTTVKAGTVLGFCKTIADDPRSGKIIPYNSTECTTDDFYILLQDVENTSSSAADFGMCRVLDGGEINRNKLILVDSNDELTEAFIAKLKTSGIFAVRVSEETNGDIL